MICISELVNFRKLRLRRVVSRAHGNQLEPASEPVFLVTILKARTYKPLTQTGNLLDNLHIVSHLILKTMP